MLQRMPGVPHPGVLASPNKGASYQAATLLSPGKHVQVGGDHEGMSRFSERSKQISPAPRVLNRASPQGPKQSSPAHIQGPKQSSPAHTPGLVRYRSSEELGSADPLKTPELLTQEQRILQKQVSDVIMTS